MPVPSLAGLCRRVIWDNIDELSYVSTLPYFKVRDLLKQVKTASQLATIEEYSPQIIGQDAELWEAFCRRDFRVPMNRDPENAEPKDPREWRKVYEYFAEKERMEEAKALEILAGTYAGLNKMKMENKTTIGDPRKLPKAPSSLAFGRSRGKGPGPGSATLTFGGGARTSNAVQKAKKEAMEAAARKRLSVPKTMRPTAHLAKVTKAPESMKTEFRIRAQPKFIPAPVPTVAKRPREEDDERAQMEARLLAAKKPKVQPKATSDEERRSSSSKSAEGSKALATPRSESTPSTTPKRPRSLMMRPQSASIQQGKVTVKTVGQPSKGASPEKTAGDLKTKSGTSTPAAPNNPTSSAATSTSTPTQQTSRPGASKLAGEARHSTKDARARVAQVSSPACEGYKLSKIAPTRASRSPSVDPVFHGSSGSEAAGSSGRRSSSVSSSSRASSPAAPQPARPTKPASTTSAAPAKHEAELSSPPKRKLNEAPAATKGGSSAAAAHPPAKKKKVDIFMRRKR